MLKKLHLQKLSKILLGVFLFFLVSHSLSAQKINEFEPNPDGTDPEMVSVELKGTPNQDFTGWLLSIESDNTSGPGLVDRASEVTGTFDANGLLVVSIPDLENPSFTFVLSTGFTGTVGTTDIDTNDDGVIEDASALGTVLDAIGIPDAASDEATIYGVALGGADFKVPLIDTNAEYEIVFRDAAKDNLYGVNFTASQVIIDINGESVVAGAFDIDPIAGTTFGSINPAALDVVLTTVTMEYQIIADLDAVEENLTDNTVDTGSSDLELGKDGAAQRVGLRFPQILIPASATINSAYIQFTVDEDVIEDPCIQTIYVEDAANASAFTGENGALTTRTSASTTATWTIPSGSWTTVGESGDDQRTIDIAPLVTQIISKDGWAIGNAMAFFLEGSGKRVAETAGATGPKLVVNISAPEGDLISIGNDITSFVLNSNDNQQLNEELIGVISGTEITLLVPAGLDISALIPTISVSDDASVLPASGAAVDFTAPVTYTVTAEDGGVQNYLVTVVESIYEEEFQADPFTDEIGWSQVSVVGDAATWVYSENDNWVEVNPFGSSGDNCIGDDWLFSPALDMDATESEVLIVTLDEGFSGADLDILYSTTYVKGEMPNAADFELIRKVASGEKGTYLFDVSGVSGMATIAFRYNDSDGSCSEWRLVDFALGGKTPKPLTLQLLHYADVDGNEETALDAVDEFSALVNAFQNNAILKDNTLTVTSGDIIIPGPRHFVAEQSAIRAKTGSDEGGHLDIVFANEFGVQAATIGNHELDLGPDNFFDAAFQVESNSGNTFTGSDFPWLSANIDFSGDPDFLSITGENGATVEELKNKVAASAIVFIGGEKIGIVGAASPIFPNITSPGDLTFMPGVMFEIPELAAVIQPIVNELKEDGVNKIILLAHMQQIAVEKALAELLDGVDIIVAGGSNTRMGNTEASTVFPGDEAFVEEYPYATNSISDEPVLVVNVDADYKYLGRLVVDFDSRGIIDLSSIDKAESSSFASTAENVTALGGTPIARVVELRDDIVNIIETQTANVIGFTSVYLDGRRSAVRTQETNLGNLTADANLWYANILDTDQVDISLKNGGGIRAEVGFSAIPAGSTNANDIQFFAPENGAVSEFDLKSVMRFNNGLSRLTVTAAELKDIMEHGVAASAPGSTPGQFPQIGGMQIEYDLLRTARDGKDSGDRIVSLIVTGADGSGSDVVVENGVLVGNTSRTYNLVTLNFLASGGDSYPFPDLSAANRVDYYDPMFLDLDPGKSDITAHGAEQDALSEFMQEFHSTIETAFDKAETPASLDERIAIVSTVATKDDPLPVFVDVLAFNLLGTFKVPGEVFDESAAEIPAYDAKRSQIFFTDANSDVVHVLDNSNPASPILKTSINLLGSPNSVAVYGDIVAVATEADPKTDPGLVEFFNAETFAAIGTVTVGALPDMVTFNEDGTVILTANEGEPNDDYSIDPEGSISIVTLNTADLSASTVATASFTGVTIPDGVRIFGGSAKGLGDRATGTIATVAQDMEPEYITVSGNIAYVTCQENNALAIVDIATATITSVLPLGTQDHSIAGNGIDASDRDGQIAITQFPVFGMYMPDAITSYNVGDKTYLITANEGDAREYIYEDMNGEEVLAFGEEERVKDLTLDPDAFVGIDFLQSDEEMGRLTVTTIDGDTDNDGDYDELYVYGTRSFTIWDASTGAVVWDSQNALEQLIAQRIPEHFNATNDENNFDNRSDNNGPEPEGVVIGEVNGKPYAFVGLERVGGIVSYDITDPMNPVFASYFNNRDFSKNEDELEAGMGGDLGPEGLAFVPAEESPTLKALLIVTNEVSGTVSTFEVGTAIEPPMVYIAVSSNVLEEGGAPIDVVATASRAVVGDQSVNVTVTGVGAMDVILSEATLTIASGMMSGMVTLSVIDDEESEDVEALEVTLSSPSNGLILGNTVSASLTIVASDPLSVSSMLADLSVYPNPAESFIEISHPSFEIDEVNILSLSGQLIRKASLEQGKLDVSDLKSGIYILELNATGFYSNVNVRILKL